MTDSAPVRSITVELQTSCRATPETVWATLVDDIDAWWQAPYVRSAERTSLTLDPRPGGLLLETWGEYGGAVWATVTASRAPYVLSFDGTFMMNEALAGSVDISIASAGEDVTISLIQRALGAIDDDTVALWQRGWTDLLGALASHAIGIEVAS